MEWVFFAVSVNGALFTLNALRPVDLRHRWLSAPSFVLSYLTIELAWLHLVAQVAATAWFARRGALRTRPGKLALVVSVASWAGLLASLARSLGARAEIAAAFAGADLSAVPDRRLGVKVTRNLTYARVDRAGARPARSLRLDVYQPRRRLAGDAPTARAAVGAGSPARAAVGAGSPARAAVGAGRPARAAVGAGSPARRPAVLQIHGGAWVFGDKREQGIPLLRHLAAQGWVGFNANYRLSPRATFPDMLVDLKRALVWIRAHADEYDVDPDFVVVTGGSAGGHLAALVALTADDPRYQPGFEDADTSVQACIPFYGVYDFTNRGSHYPDRVVRGFFARHIVKASLDEQPERFAAASPMDQITADAPPFLVIHGDADTVVPVGMARDFVAALRSTSAAPTLYLELRGAQHAFDTFPSIRGSQVIAAVDRFVDKLWSEHRHGRKAADVPAGELTGAVDAATADLSRGPGAEDLTG